MSYTLLARQIFEPVRILRYLLFAGIPALLFYGFSMLLMSSVGFETMQILRDPAQQLEQSSFLGFLSNIGVWLWVSSAAICLFAAFNPNAVPGDDRKELLLLVGALSIILAVDDFFMIHDRYVNQKICFVLYAICACAILLRHTRKIIEIDAFSFILAGSLLGLSIVIDVVAIHTPFDYVTLQIVEEGCKFVGAATWLFFSCRVASWQGATVPAATTVSRLRRAAGTTVSQTPA